MSAVAEALAWLADLARNYQQDGYVADAKKLRRIARMLKEATDASNARPKRRRSK